MTVSGEYRAIASRVRALPGQLSRAGAAEMDRKIRERLAADTGGDYVLSGMLKRGRARPLNTRIRVSGDTATVSADPPAGQWRWLEEGTATRHMGAWHMKVGGRWRTGPWTASGTRAKHTFTEGAEAGSDAAFVEMSKLWERTVV